MTFIQGFQSLYLHVPFCRTKCTYCAFNAYANMDGLVQDFVKALIREVEIVGHSRPGQYLHTIYFGGGTPSMLTPEQFDQILNTIHAVFIVRSNAEISLEANPNDLDAPYLTALHRLGFNRLSIGVQSAHENELRLFARRHDNDAVARAVSAARKAGFANINLDLIYGFPHQTMESWRASLEQMAALQPEHVSLYALGVEEGTPLARWISRGELPEPDDDLAADMYDAATDMLGGFGFEQYEISNWAKPGFECQHNLQYWRNLPYPGVGPGAHGWAGGVRYSTILAPQKYIIAMQNSSGDYVYPRTPATFEANDVGKSDEIVDTLLMGLRLTREGIQRAVFQERFDEDVMVRYGDLINDFSERGLLQIDEKAVRLTAKGRLLSNIIFRELV
ncbi:MAG: radical SAM family heme chaperone HemW [Anaerolineaceae bacterium]|nr:radical SAM family heme chaperone HemW [Anaerolineaceae bacterium]